MQRTLQDILSLVLRKPHRNHSIPYMTLYNCFQKKAHKET